MRVTALVSTYHLELCSAMAASPARSSSPGRHGARGLTELPAPGAFELPILARAAARRDDGLCAVLRPRAHRRNLARPLGQHGRHPGHPAGEPETDKPVLFGVLTCQTLEQARMRALPPSAGGKQDKGREVARAALLALDTLDRIQRA
ncbi:MAG: 6,7-dimethyl-8-ribityllumazine synthase [Planctomycetota bacterium]